MKTTIDKEFFEKWEDKEVAMWCKKKEYAEEFCRLMHVQGLRWNTDESYLSKNIWDSYTTKTTYSFNEGLYTDKDWYDSKGYTILDFEDYIVKEKMTKKELVKLLVENFTDEDGVLNLSELDFTKYDCEVDISWMKVSRTLIQNNQKAGDIFQDEQEVKGSLFQNRQKVGEDLYQDYQTVTGHLFQSNQVVGLDLFQRYQIVGLNLYQEFQEVQGDLHQERAENKFISNEPSHYSIDGIDTMDLILKICEHNNTDVREGFYLANTLKYLIRYNNKNGIDDLEKAKDYLNRLINNQKGE